mgnify:CR=1 FL=1
MWKIQKYILNHYPRHMGILFVALDKLDKASLAAQRRLTIPFVKTVLQNEGKNDESSDGNAGTIQPQRYNPKIKSL